MLNVGDYATVATHGWQAAVIRFGTRSTVNHAFVYVGQGQIVEAQPGGAVLSPVSRYDAYGPHWSHIPLTDEQRTDIAAEARLMVGVPYNWVDIAALTLKQWHVVLPGVNKRIENDKKLICSQLVDAAYLRAGVHLFEDGRLTGDVTPQDLYQLSH